MEYLRRRVRGDSVFQIMVRPSEDGKQFLMTELPQPEIDPEMKAILEEQKKPVSTWVPELGTFTAQTGWSTGSKPRWSGWASPPGWTSTGRRTGTPAWSRPRPLWPTRRAGTRRCAPSPPQELLSQANDWAQDAAESEDGESPEEITREQFMERMELDAVQISADGRFEFWFNDGEMFWGHSIHVTGSLDQGPEMAQMEG